MEYPNISFHVHQILSALHDISNHLLYLPDPYREMLSSSLSEVRDHFNEMISDVDLHAGNLSLADQFKASDQAADVSPFIRTEAVEHFNSYIALNADGVFTYANPTAFTIFGRSESDLKGQNIWEVLPELKQGPLYSTFQQAVTSREPAHVEMRGIDNRCFAINIHPTRNGVILYWLDISEQKNIEEALRASEERLRAAIETAPINVFTLDKNLRYVWIGSRRDGFFHEPVLGKRDDELLPAQDASILLEVEQYVLDTGKGQRKEVRFQKNGKLQIYAMAIEPLFDSLNHVVGLTVAVMDVTEQRRVEAERTAYADKMELQRRLLEHSEMERMELARNLHDGPIQRLVGLGFSLQVVKEILEKEETNEKPDLNQMGLDIKSAITELRGFCNELRPPVLSRLGLRRALLEQIDDFQTKNPHLKIHVDFATDLSSVNDQISLALYRIYQHALSNIVRHSAADEVWLRLSMHGQHIHFEIKDNGIGISNPVDWVEYAQKGHLGMVGMKERAEAVGGTMQIISEDGLGTLVKVVVPISENA